MQCISNTIRLVGLPYKCRSTIPQFDYIWFIIHLVSFLWFTKKLFSLFQRGIFPLRDSGRTPCSVQKVYFYFRSSNIPSVWADYRRVCNFHWLFVLVPSELLQCLDQHNHILFAKDISKVTLEMTQLLSCHPVLVMLSLNQGRAQLGGGRGVDRNLVIITFLGLIWF